MPDSITPSTSLLLFATHVHLNHLRLQVGAKLRPPLALDDAAHDEALEMLVRAPLEKDASFLYHAMLHDDDERGFSLLHHAAVFGNVGKVQADLASIPGVESTVPSRMRRTQYVVHRSRLGGSFGNSLGMSMFLSRSN